MLFTIIGWIGSICLLIAYGGQAFGKISGTSKFYLSLNLIGAFCLTVFTVEMKAYPPATVNFVWIVLTIYGIYKNL